LSCDEERTIKKNKMEMSKKDRLITVAIMAIGTIIYLLIAYDPLIS